MWLLSSYVEVFHLRDDIIRMEELLKEVQGTLLIFPPCTTQRETAPNEVLTQDTKMETSTPTTV